MVVNPIYLPYPPCSSLRFPSSFARSPFHASLSTSDASLPRELFPPRSFARSFSARADRANLPCVSIIGNSASPSTDTGVRSFSSGKLPILKIKMEKKRKQYEFIKSVFIRALSTKDTNFVRNISTMEYGESTKKDGFHFENANVYLFTFLSEGAQERNVIRRDCKPLIAT